MNTIIVIASLVFVGGIFAAAIVDQRRDRKRQPPVEMPEWLQGLTHEQLRELLRAKQHKTQPQLHAMADNMRALNAAPHRSSLVEPAAVEFNTGELEVRHAH